MCHLTHFQENKFKRLARKHKTFYTMLVQQLLGRLGLEFNILQLVKVGNFHSL